MATVDELEERVERIEEVIERIMALKKNCNIDRIDRRKLGLIARELLSIRGDYTSRMEEILTRDAFMQGYESYMAYLEKALSQTHGKSCAKRVVHDFEEGDEQVIIDSLGMEEYERFRDYVRRKRELFESLFESSIWRERGELELMKTIGRGRLAVNFALFPDDFYISLFEKIEKKYGSYS
ncbi:MAG: hypothetical protein D6734_00465 [Candidatus Schekmanbacteria bacterium]|nr:MAG: hypothetical protein D6734_00465 [Candidatus Schekmanbacteria bacterium]